MEIIELMDQIRKLAEELVSRKPDIDAQLEDKAADNAIAWGYDILAGYYRRYGQ